ncbi:MAG: trimethylamine methyltransferase family protein [Anaerolineae bacterium]|nr:trimethylamine methyltransferase family protein [Anaerolineae bacterium]
MNRPRFTFLDETTIADVLYEAYRLLWDPGVLLYSEDAADLLREAGATVENPDVHGAQVARIPLELARVALSAVPSSFDLYGADGGRRVHYGGDCVQFNPGSAAIEVLDPGATQTRQPVTADLVRATRLADALDAFDAASTCLVSSDVPEAVGDMYRLYIALKHTGKPVVTGAFGVGTWPRMYEMLVAAAGGEDALAAKPRAIFDVCPLSPLRWSAESSGDLLDCARHGVPAQIVTTPLAGATAPVTLLGVVVQHAAETLSGVVLHQLAKPGAPVVWGGLPAAFDMKTGTTATGAVETMMLNIACAQVGQYLGLPTQAYLGLSDAKVLDMQAGFETGMGALLGALACVNMISGPGVLDFVRVFSLEKLVIDAEIVQMVRRLHEGMVQRDAPIALDLIRAVGHGGAFLTEPHTVDWFREELLFPSPVIDRDARTIWEAKGSPGMISRARTRVETLLAERAPYEPPGDVARALDEIMLGAAKMHGMEKLPG